MFIDGKWFTIFERWSWYRHMAEMDIEQEENLISILKSRIQRKYYFWFYVQIKSVSTQRLLWSCNVVGKEKIWQHLKKPLEQKTSLHRGGKVSLISWKI